MAPRFRIRSPIAFLLPNLNHLGPAVRRHRRAFLIGYLCTVITSGFSLAIPMVLGSGIRHLETGAPGGMLRYGLWLSGLALISGVFLYFMRLILIGASRRIEYELRGEYFQHLQSLPLSFFNAQKTGDLMARVTNDLNAVRDVLGPGVMYGMNTVTVVTASMVLMIRLDPPLAVAALLPLPLLAFLVRYFAGEMHRRSRDVQDHYGVLSAALQENIAGIRVVQSYAQEPFEILHFGTLSRKYMRLGFRLIRYRALFFSMMGSLVGLLMLVLLWIGGLRVIRGAIGLGDFVAFMGYLGMLTWPFIALGWVLSLIQRGEASMARMLEIRRIEPEIADAEITIDQPPIVGSIRFQGVRFRFDPDGPEVLQGIDEAVPAGSTLAIIGRTGSGKTALLSLIPRLHDPTAGAVLLDGIDVRRRSLASIRSAIAVVPQESFLFSDTVRANIQLGRPEATEEELHRAVRLARLERDLEQFPHGLDTRVGERGITLSGGQRQRVALARALLADPLILILDDALSSVDKITESELLEGLSSFRKGRTTIIVAHRISTTRDADRILVLHDGQVVEAGNHEELLRRAGVYAAMERRQRLAEEIEDVPAA